MENLTNPLRSKPLRTLPTQENSKPTSTPIANQEAPKAISMERPNLEQKPSAMIPHSIEVTSNPELKRAMELLAKHGIETAPSKKNYIKHSYEVEENLHKEFHEMYPILGFKHVKTAINDAIRMWCDTNRKEFNRRKGA